jgi:CheY-like chemotaxis protein
LGAITVDHHAHLTILAIDDEAEALSHLSDVLAGAGYTCHCARDASGAAEIMRQAMPDLIISDINLAGYNALAICEQLKQEAGIGHVPVMFLSAAQSPDIIRRAHAVGGTYYVRKPFDAAVLLELVAKALPVAHLTGA